MKLNKKNIINFVIVTLFILLFLLKFIGRVFSDEVKDIVTIIVGLLVFILMIFEIYDDINDKQFTTTVYIVLADIIQLIAFIVVGYYSFKSYDKDNLEVILNRRSEFGILSGLFYLGARFVRDYLKSQKFMKGA